MDHIGIVFCREYFYSATKISNKVETPRFFVKILFLRPTN